MTEPAAPDPDSPEAAEEQRAANVGAWLDANATMEDLFDAIHRRSTHLLLARIAEPKTIGEGEARDDIACGYAGGAVAALGLAVYSGIYVARRIFGEPKR